MSTDILIDDNILGLDYFIEDEFCLDLYDLIVYNEIIEFCEEAEEYCKEIEDSNEEVTVINRVRHGKYTPLPPPFAYSLKINSDWLDMLREDNPPFHQWERDILLGNRDEWFSESYLYRVRKKLEKYIKTEEVTQAKVEIQKFPICVEECLNSRLSILRNRLIELSLRRFNINVFKKIYEQMPMDRLKTIKCPKCKGALSKNSSMLFSSEQIRKHMEQKYLCKKCGYVFVLKTRYIQELKQELFRGILRKNSYGSYRHISEALKVSPSTLSNWLKKWQGDLI